MKTLQHLLHVGSWGSVKHNLMITTLRILGCLTNAEGWSRVIHFICAGKDATPTRPSLSESERLCLLVPFVPSALVRVTSSV